MFVIQVDLDFRLHFPDHVGSLFKELPKLAPGIISAARLSRKISVVELIREYDEQQHSAELSIRDYSYAVLALLHLLPSSNTRQKGRLSCTELEKSLVAFKPEHCCIAEILNAKKDDPNKQPSLLCLGSKDKPLKFFIILDAQAVGLGDCGIVRAVDCLFKAHHVFWVDYGKCLERFMEFLQKVIYKIEASKLSPRVQELHRSILSLTASEIE